MISFFSFYKTLSTIKYDFLDKTKMLLDHKTKYFYYQQI